MKKWLRKFFRKAERVRDKVTGRNAERDMWSAVADMEADLMPPKMREEYMESRRRAHEKREQEEAD